MRIRIPTIISHSVRLLALAFLMGWTWTSQAQVSISVNIYYNTYPGQSSYYIQVPITTTNAILTYDEVISPRTNFMATVDSNGFSDNSTFVTLTQFSDLADAVTNGNWLFITDAGTASQKAYSFQITSSNFTSNDMPGFQVTYPMPQEAIGVTNVTFTWEDGPTNYTDLTVFLHNTDYSYFQGVGIDPQYYSSWNFGTPLSGSDTNFYLDVNYEISATNILAVSTPLTTNGQAVPGWSATSTLNLVENNGMYADSDGVHFTLTTNLNSATTGGGHTNLVYYSFEDNNIFAHDFSGNGNDIDGVSWDLAPPYITNDAAAGSYAVGFAGASSGAGWLSVPTNLVTTLAGSFSAALWARTSQDRGADSDTADAGSGLMAANSDQVIPLALTGSKLAFLTGGGSPDTLHSVTSVNTGNYVHLVVTRDQASGIKKIYINGNLDASDFGVSGLLTSSSSPNLYLGADTSIVNGFAGDMDEVQIYSGVLSSNDVNYLYNHPGTAVPDTSGQDFNAALGSTNLAWATGGDTDWFIETTNTQNGISAAQSGSVTNQQSSTLAATVAGPGTLTFYWSSIANDPNGGFYCEFYLDGNANGNYLDEISGDSSWDQDGPFNIPAGQHTLDWTAFADGDTNGAEAAYLDEVTYIQDTIPVISQNPFSQTNFSGYPVWLSATATGVPSPTWQWFEVGSGAIAGATTNFYIPTNSGSAGVAGSYYAVAMNPAGSATTLTAAVTFVSAPLPPGWSAAVKSPFYAENTTNVIRDYYSGCAVDSAGNVYAADQYVGDVSVESNFVTLTTLTTVGPNGTAALVKNNPSGHAIWAVGLTNNDPASYGYSVCVALAPGNGAYLAADLIGTNWLGTNLFADNGGGSVLLARFDANGSNIWAKFIGLSNIVSSSYNDLVSDDSGNVTLTGVFSGTLDFGGTNLTAPSGFGGFLVQYNSNGALVWAQALSGYPHNLAESGGQIYLSFSAGISGGVTNISIGSLSNLTDRAYGFAAVSSATGHALWLRGVGEQFGAQTSGPTDVPLISANGSDLFLTGSADGSNAVFGGISVPITGGRGQYFARYDTNGNPQVATSFGSATTMPWASAANSSGVYISGDFDDYSFFGDYLIAAPEYAPSYLGSNYFTQPFVAKFDRDGNPLWALNGLSPLLANFRGIALASDGVWASGIVEIANGLQYAQFGANTVDSDGYYYDYGSGVTFFFTQGGLLAKITEAAMALPVTLLEPQIVGANFQFQFLSQAGFTHNILYQTNLAEGNWLTNAVVTGDGTVKTNSIPLSIFSPSKQGFVRISTQ